MLHVAEYQKGVISRAQLHKAGLSDNQIGRRVASGTFVRLHAGVFAITGSPDSFERRLIAALLAVGPEAVASHRAAAFLYRFDGVRARVEISLPHRKRPRLRGVVIHRVTSLPREHTDQRGAIRLTTVARTICDVAAIYPGKGLESLLDEALARRLVTRGEILATMGGMPSNFEGAGMLRALLDDRPEGRARVESPLEQELQELLRSARITGWIPQHSVAGCRVDVAFPDASLAVQVDSFRHHSSRSDWARDHRRHAALVQAGWRVLPVTLEDLREGDHLVARIRSALGTFSTARR
jgi:very-short-patch-repair endonuclease